MKAIVICYLSSSGLCFADSRTIAGRKFEVDQLVAVDSSLIRIEVGERVELVPRAEVDTRVLRMLFEARRELLNPKLLEDMFVSTQTTKNYELGSEIAELYCEWPRERRQALNDLFDRVVDVEYVTQISAQLRNRLRLSKEGTAELYLWSLRKYQPWNIEDMPVDSDIAGKLLWNEYHSALHLDDTALRNQTIAACREHFKTNSDCLKLAAEDAFLGDFVSVMLQFDCARMSVLLDELFGVPHSSALQEYAILAVQREAFRRLAADQAIPALDVLICAGTRGRTEATHDLLIKVLAAIGSHSTALPFSDKRDAYLRFMASQDSRIQELVSRIQWTGAPQIQETAPIAVFLGGLVLVSLLIIAAWHMVFFRQGRDSVTDDLSLYHSYLSAFGLPIEASESQIKSSYREAVKLHHPDAAKNKCDSTNRELVALNERYDRLMLLRRKLGYRD